MKKNLLLSFSFLMTLILGNNSFAQCDISWLEYSAGSHEICSGADIEFRIYTFLSHDVSWDFGDGTSSSENFPMKSFNANGTYYTSAQLTLTCGKDTTIYDTIVVKDNPSFSWDTHLLFTDNICPNEEITVQLMNWIPREETTWDFGDGSSTVTDGSYEISHQYSSVGAFPLTAVVRDQCGNDTTIRDTINVIQKSGYDPNTYVYFYTDTVCIGQKASPYMSNAGNPDSLTWSVSDGQTATGLNPEFSFSSNGVYQVNVRAVDGCGNDTTLSTAVVVGNTNHFQGYLQLDIPDSLCPGDPIKVYANNDLVNASWNFGDGTIESSSSEVTHKYTQAGSYTIVHTASDICGLTDTLSQDIVVATNLDRIDLSMDLIDSVCIGDPIFADAWSNTDSLLWDFGNGATSNNNFFMNHSYSTNGVKVISLTATNGCGISKTLQDSLYVGTNISANAEMIELNHNSQVCLGDSISFLSIPYYGTIELFFGDGQSSNSLTKDSVTFVDENVTLQVGTASHKYTAEGDYHPYYILTNGCGLKDTADTETTISVVTSSNHSIEVDVSVISMNEDDTEVCNNEPVELVFEGASNYEVDYGDGSTEIFVAGDQVIKRHTYADSGSYKVVLIGSNSCGQRDTVDTMVKIKKCTSNSSALSVTNFNSKIYPNPTDGIVNIEMDETGDYRINVVNIQGQIVQSVSTSSTSSQLNMAGLKEGVYFIQIIGNGSSIVKQLVLVK